MTGTEMQSPLIFTDAAAVKVRELMVEEGNETLMLRVFISGGRVFGFSIRIHL